MARCPTSFETYQASENEASISELNGQSDWFERDGLKVLGSQSFIRNNLRLIQQGKIHQLNPAEPVQTRCSACNKTLASVCEYTSTEVARKYRAVKVQTYDKRTQKIFCWKCAASRQTMIDTFHEAEWNHHVAPDGEDVFRFIEQTIFEDKIADELNIDWLQCHVGHRGQIDKPYRWKMGGPYYSPCAIKACIRAPFAPMKSQLSKSEALTDAPSQFVDIQVTRSRTLVETTTPRTDVQFEES